MLGEGRKVLAGVSVVPELRSRALMQMGVVLSLPGSLKVTELDVHSSAQGESPTVRADI